MRTQGESHEYKELFSGSGESGSGGLPSTCQAHKGAKEVELGTTQESKQPICGTGACGLQLAWPAHGPEPVAQPPRLPGEMDMSWLLAALGLSAATALPPLQVPIITPHSEHILTHTRPRCICSF